MHNHSSYADGFEDAERHLPADEAPKLGSDRKRKRKYQGEEPVRQAKRLRLATGYLPVPESFESRTEATAMPPQLPLGLDAEPERYSQCSDDGDDPFGLIDVLDRYETPTLSRHVHTHDGLALRERHLPVPRPEDEARPGSKANITGSEACPNINVALRLSNITAPKRNATDSTSGSSSGSQWYAWSEDKVTDPDNDVYETSGSEEELEENATQVGPEPDFLCMFDGFVSDEDELWQGF